MFSRQVGLVGNVVVLSLRPSHDFIHNASAITPSTRGSHLAHITLASFSCSRRATYTALTDARIRVMIRVAIHVWYPGSQRYFTVKNSNPLTRYCRTCKQASTCLLVSPVFTGTSVSGPLAWRPLHARRAILHDLDAALPGRLRRGRCACPPPPLASRAHRGLWPHRRPLRVCRARLLFADRLRAGAGRRSGSGWRQGRV